MAGTITAEPSLPPCDSNGKVAVNITFEITNGSANGYDVLMDGNSIGNYAYTSGVNSITIQLEGDGQNHDIKIQDVDNVNCSISAKARKASMSTYVSVGFRSEYA